MVKKVRPSIIFCEGKHDLDLCSSLLKKLGLTYRLVTHEEFIKEGRYGETKIISEYLRDHNSRSRKKNRFLIKDENGKPNVIDNFTFFSQQLAEEDVKIISILDGDFGRSKKKMQKTLKEQSKDYLQSSGQFVYRTKNGQKCFFISKSLEKQIKEKTGKSIDLLEDTPRKKVIKEFIEANTSWIPELEKTIRE